MSVMPGWLVTAVEIYKIAMVATFCVMVFSMIALVLFKLIDRDNEKIRIIKIEDEADRIWRINFK